VGQALINHGVVADASDTGTGKTYKVLSVAKLLNRPVAVVCPKAVIPEWRRVAALFEVPCEVINYEMVRTGKTHLGRWQVKGKVFEWTLSSRCLLIFDEAHNCGGQKTQNSRLLIAAKRQQIPTALLSATLIANPLKAYAIGFALGLHKLTDYWNWAARHGVTKGYFGMEWKPFLSEAEAIMQRIRTAIGPRFTRIRKADVPDFPQNQVIPTFVETKDLSEIAGDYSVGSRQIVEMAKVGSMADMAEELVEDGKSVVIFVNFVATLDALRERFPQAGVIRGGQSSTERSEAINRFQQNAEPVLLVMSQAGGTGLSLHDLNGRPRAAIISPGWSAVEFLQVLGRIHRAGSLSPAINYVAFAPSVSVERRIRTKLEQKLNNLTALNDHDLESPTHTGGGSQEAGGTPGDAEPAHSDHNHGYLSGHLESVAAHLGGSGGAGAKQPASEGYSTEDRPAGVGCADPLVGTGFVERGGDAVSTPQQKSTPHGERKHARSSPSKLKNLEICPSYVGEDGPPHPVTLRGTAMHEALETGSDAALDPADPVTGERLNTERDLVTMVREYIEAEKSAYGITTTLDEQHLKTHDPDVQGFVDRVMFSARDAQGKRKAYIRDYKFGYNVVDHPKINPQAIAYTVGTFLKWPDVEEVNFSFMIPRCDAILEHTFTRADLPELKLRISTIAERVRKLAGKERNPVTENCLYCGEKATCPALHAKALVIANGYNEDDKLALPAEFHSSLITDPVQMAKALNAVTVIEKWCESVRSHAVKLRLEVGVEIPGYQLIERQGKRTVADPVKAFEIAKEFGVSEQEYIAAADISIPTLEKAVAAKVEKGKAKRVEEFSDRLLDEMAVVKGQPFHVLQKERKKAKAA
jgi:superfamily II DNA or RNA helicase